MNHIKIVGRAITLMLLLAAVFAQSTINAQSLDATEGITINYLRTVSDGNKLDVSVLAPMYYHDNKSVFFLNDVLGNSVEFNDDDPSDMKVSIKFGNDLESFYFVDRDDEKIIGQRVLFDESINVEEDIPDFDWSITGESKKIAEYDCYEAVTSFRGRFYSAWFTPDVPLDIGPWKFSGLPGAILQVNDKEGQYNWYCKSIGKLSPENQELIKAPQNKKILSPKEFYDLSVEKLMAILGKMTADPDVHITSDPTFEASIERTFN